jgi:hypothetical protein
MYPFVMRENYADSDEILGIILTFIQMVLGQFET